MKEIWIKADYHNWGLCSCLAGWVSTEWTVFKDGSYEVVNKGENRI